MSKNTDHRATPLHGHGSRVPTRPLGSAMFSEQAWEEIRCRLRLSGRELQLVQGVFDDETELGIAAGLRISPHTVHTHFERLHRKLAVPDRAQILIRVMQEFLILTGSSGCELPPICANHSAGLCPLRVG